MIESKEAVENLDEILSVDMKPQNLGADKSKGGKG